MQVRSNAPAVTLRWGQRMNDSTHRTASSEPDRRAILEMGVAAASLTVAPIAASAETGMSEIVRMDALSLGRAIAARNLSCVEVMSAYLDHIAALNPKVNAIVALQDRGDLLAQAHARDAQVARGDIMGPLHGFPHAPKDLQSVRGIRSHRDLRS